MDVNTNADRIIMDKLSEDTAIALEKRLTYTSTSIGKRNDGQIDVGSTNTPVVSESCSVLAIPSKMSSSLGDTVINSNSDDVVVQTQPADTAVLSVTENHGKTEKTCTGKVATKVLKRDRKVKRKRRKEKIYQHLFRDSFQMEIPLTVTADLGIALQRSRANRIKAIYRYFPSIKDEQMKQQQQQQEKDNQSKANDDNNNAQGDPLGDSSRGGSKKKPLPKLKNVPKAQDYASVIDYLEAKYVQGIMIDHETDSKSAGDNANDDDGGGSVYSESSFLDDRALQRTIAEQVLGQATTTKLELIDDNDDDFFVNVGPLEVEETELTNLDYDPLKDTEKDKADATKRKRIQKKMDKSIDSSSKERAKPANDEPKKDKVEKSKAKSDLDKGKTTTSTEASGKKKKPVDIEKEDQPPTKKIRIDENEKSTATTKKADKLDKSQPKSNTTEKSKSVTTPDTKAKKKPSKKPMSEVTKQFLKKSKACRRSVDMQLKKIEEYVNTASDEELPKKSKKKLRVELRCPADKKTGDMITFANPHVPGQKLRVKIPATRSSTGVFKVTVPLPSNDSDVDPDVDYNRVSRKFYGLLEEYAQYFDEWCDAEGEYRAHMGDTEFTAHFEKRKKFDPLIPFFPNTELKTPVDKAYLQKILRRARQNKNKRDKLMQKAANETTFHSTQSSRKGKHDDDNDDDDDVKPSKKVEASSSSTTVQKLAKKVEPKRLSIIVPQLSTIFPRKKFSSKEIQQIWNSDTFTKQLLNAA